MATLGLDTSEYEQGIEQARKETQSAANSLNRSANTAGSGVSGMASQFAAASAKATVLANMLTSLGTKAVGLAKGFVEMGISYNAQIEKYTTGFTNMLGSAEAAQQVMSQIQEDAAKTPFDVESLTKANQYLISAGENASYARSTIMALGDAVSATGGGNDELNRMSQNLQQIANTGKATAADIKQFAYAGIDVYGILADYTGKSTAEVQNMTISYDLLTQALQAASEEGGRYYNSMDTQSQTMNGRVSTLNDNVKQLAGLLTGDLSSGIGVAIGKLNDMVVAAQEAYKLDGWKGLIGEITGLTTVIDKAKSSAVGLKAVFDALKSGEIGIFHGDWDAVYQKAFNNDYQNRKAGKKDTDYWKEYGERLKKQYGIKETNSSSIVTTGGGGGYSGSSGSKSTTETVISSISSTTTNTAQNALGAVTTSVETLQEKVKDAAGNIKDRVTETTTETGKEMVNGVATTHTLVTKKASDADDHISTTTKKVYADMSKTLLGTLTTIAEKTFNGITTTTQQAVETYADGSQHIKTTATETGERIVNGVRQTYTKVISYIDGVQDKVTETAQNIDKSIKATQKRIDGNLSKVQQQLNNGIFKIGKNLYTDLKNQDWAALGLDIVNMMWGEVSQEQREVLSDWASKALEAINEAYSGGGLSEAFNAFKKIMSNGIKADADGVTTDVKGLSNVFQDLGINVSDVGSKIMSILGTIGTSMGTFATEAGTKIAGLSGSMGNLGVIAQGAGGLIAKVGSLIMANPEVAAIIAIVAGVVALGAALFAKFGKGKSSSTTSTQKAYSYKEIQDAYWYGNERAFAGYDYRTDPFMFNPNNSAVIGYQTKMQEQLAKLTDVVQQYLPDVANQQIVLDDGTLVGKMAPGMNAELGQMQILSERGN